MKKILITLSDTGIKNLLERQFPDHEVLFSNEVELSIDDEAYILVTSIEHIETATLDTISDTLVFLLDLAKEYKPKKQSLFYIYEDIDKMRDDILTAILENRSSIEKNKKAPLSSSPLTTTQFKEKDVQAEKNKESTNNTPNMMSFFDPANSKNDEVVDVVNERIEEDEIESNSSKPVSLEDYPTNHNHVKQSFRFENAATLKKVMRQTKIDANKTIGVWSPVNKIGVTTFIINFAIFLRRYEIKLAVMELPNNQLSIKKILDRYDSTPLDWLSFFENYNSKEAKPTNVLWQYKGVSWLPLGNNDHTSTWNRETISDYFWTTNDYEVVLTDFPTGKMSSSSLDSLRYLDELWIFIDDNFHQELEWKGYVHQLIKDYQLNVNLIFNRECSHSQINKIVELMELPLLISLPEMFVQTQKNNYETHPLIEKLTVKRKLLPKYELIAKHILGEKYHLSFWNKFQKMFLPKVDSE